MSNFVSEFESKHHIIKLEKNAYIGTFNDYSFSYKAGAYESNFIRINAYFNDKKQEVVNYLQMNRKKLKINSYFINDYSLSLNFGAYFTNNSRLKKIDDSLEEITKFLESINIPNSKYCPLCGKEVGEENPTQTIDFEGLPIKVDRDCIDVIYKKEEENRDKFNSTPNNYGKGFLGALLGCALGFILWVIIGAFGLISSWIALLIPFIGSFFYDVLGGKRTTTKIIMVSILSFIAAISGTFVVYLIAVATEVVNENLDMSTLSAFSYLLQNSSEFVSNFVTDMVISAIFSIIGIVVSSIFMKKQVGTLYVKKRK